MPKTKVLQRAEAQSSPVDKNRPKGKMKRRKEEEKIDWSNLLRILLLLFLVGIIVFHYYLLTEDQLSHFYLEIWKSNKEVLSPLFIVIGYTLTIFLIGFRFGKRR